MSLRSLWFPDVPLQLQVDHRATVFLNHNCADAENYTPAAVVTKTGKADFCMCHV